MYKNEDDDSEIMPIVIDNGSGIIKAGFAGDELPQIEYSNAVAIPKYPNGMYGNNSNENYYIGEELQRMKSVGKIKYPVRRGFIEDWDSMKVILKYTFNRLSNYSLYKRAGWYTSIDNPVMITESSVHSKRDREEMGRMMFEYFDIPAMYIHNSSVLALYGTGRTTGLVVDSGETITSATPIFEEHAISDAVNYNPYGGADIVDYLNKYQRYVDPSFNISSESLREMKEKLCYVSTDFNKEYGDPYTNDYSNTYYKLPDGTYGNYSSHLFVFPELLFRPYSNDYTGVHVMAHNSIMSGDWDLRKDLYKNIILSGGTTMLENFGDRIYREIKNLAPQNMKVKVISYPYRKYLPWIGGSILSTLRSFVGMWITKDEYDEYGESIVNRKGF